jgi:mRNA interferase MazF
MGTFAGGSVVLVRFSFSDLSQAKLRPAVILAAADRDDWLLCQITSNAYADPNAVKLEEADFQTGSLRVTSYARPAKLFTAHETLIATLLGGLKPSGHRRIVEAIVRVIQPT